MKSLILILFVYLLLLAGCGADEPVTDQATDAIAEEQPADDAGTAPEVDDEPAATQEQSQIVEESGGEPDASEDQDKPIILAQAETKAPAQDWQFKEGMHYHRMVPTQPTLGGADKVEVAEFFWYGCGHCYEFESYINPWSETKPANSRFVRIPATWNPLVKLHAQLYYTEEVLVTNGKIADPVGFRAAVFNEYHRRSNRLTSLTTIAEVFERFGVSEDDFNSTWNSFEVAQKLRVAEDLARRYAITGVPALVVNGKYRTGKADAGTYPELLEVVDELIERETIR